MRPAAQQAFNTRGLGLHTKRTHGIEGGAGKGAATGRAPEARARVQRPLEKTPRRRCAKPVFRVPWGSGTVGGEHQSLDGDSGHICPGAVQTKTQTRGIARSLHRCPGGFERAGGDRCLGRDTEKRERRERRPGRGGDLRRPPPLVVGRRSDSHRQRLQIPRRLCPLLVCVSQRVSPPGLSFPRFRMLSPDPPALCCSWPSSRAATDPGKTVGSRTLAGAKLSEWEKQNASGWVEPSADLGTEGALVPRGGEVVGFQLPFSLALPLAGSHGFRPGLGFCLLRVAGETGGSRGSADSERISPGPSGLHLPTLARRCTR